MQAPVLRLMRFVLASAATLSFAVPGAVAQQRPSAMPSASQLSDPEGHTLRSMIDVGLTDRAVRYAAAQRELASGDDSMYAKWTMRLMECYAQAALRAAEQDAAVVKAAWDSSSDVSAAFKKTAPNSPRLPWIGWQQTRGWLLQSQSLLARYLASPTDVAAREEALVLIRRIEKQTEELEDDIKRRQPLAARQSVAGGAQASAAELAELLVDVGLLRCEALLVRSGLYKPESKDRIAAATEVDAQATEILKSVGASWAARGPLEIAQATAKLNLGRADEGLLKLTELARNETGQNRAAGRAAFVAIEFLASSGQVSRAAVLLPFLESAGTAAEVELAKVMLAIAGLENLAGDQRDQRIATVLEQAKAIGVTHGSYWRNRAEALLSGSVTAESSAALTLDLVTVEVRQLLSAGNEPEAIRKLLRFRDQEAASGNADNAVALASMASALLLKNRRWSESVAAIQAVARQFPSASGAAKAHWQSVFALSQALRADAANASLSAQYEQAMIAQLENWPESQSSDQVRGWLERWLLGKGRPVDFAKTLARRAARCTSSEAREAALLDWLGVTLRLPKIDEQTSAVEVLRGEIDTGGFAGVESSAKTFSLVASAFAFWPDTAALAEQRDERKRLQGSVSRQVEQVLLAGVELLDALRSDARAVPASVQNTWQPSLLPVELLASLTPSLVAAIGEQDRRTQLQSTQLLEVSAEWLAALADSSAVEFRASALRLKLWRGEISEALDGLTKLAAENPSDGGIQLALASALADSGDNRLEASTKLAKRIAARAPAGGDLFLAARWQLVRNLLIAGQREQAAAAAKLLLASQPIESELWKSRFTQVAEGR